MRLARNVSAFVAGILVAGLVAFCHDANAQDQRTLPHNHQSLAQGGELLSIGNVDGGAFIGTADPGAFAFVDDCTMFTNCTIQWYLRGNGGAGGFGTPGVTMTFSDATSQLLFDNLGLGYKTLLRVKNVSSSSRPFIAADPAARTSIYDPATSISIAPLTSSPDGADIIDASGGNTPAFGLYNSAGTLRLAELKADLTNLFLHSENNGAAVKITGDNNTGTETDLILCDPDLVSCDGIKGEMMHQGENKIDTLGNTVTSSTLTNTELTASLRANVQYIVRGMMHVNCSGGSCGNYQVRINPSSGTPSVEMVWMMWETVVGTLVDIQQDSGVVSTITLTPTNDTNDHTVKFEGTYESTSNVTVTMQIARTGAANSIVTDPDSYWTWTATDD